MHRDAQLLRPTLRALQRLHGLVIGQVAEPHVIQILEGYEAHMLALVAGRSEEHVRQRRDWRELRGHWGLCRLRRALRDLRSLG